MFVFVVVDNVVLVLTDDVHRTEHVQRVIHSALHVLEINLLAYLDNLVRITYFAEVFVHLQNFIGYLCARNHWSFPDFLQHRFRKEYKLFVFFLFV